MIRKFHLIFFLILWPIFSCLFSSCSEKEELMTHEEMWKLAETEAGAENLKVLLPSHDVPEVDCDDYGDGCIYGLTMSAWEILMVAVRFDTEANARNAAIRNSAYYRYNWVFDDIQKEPFLQDFVKKAFKATYARDEKRYWKGDEVEKKKKGLAHGKEGKGEKGLAEKLEKGKKTKKKKSGILGRIFSI